MKKKSAQYILFVFLLLVYASCEDKNDDNQPVSTGTLEVHLHAYLGEHKLDTYNKIYTLGDGRKISPAIAQMYISNIQLITKDGVYNDLTGVKILQVLNKEVYTMDHVPEGNYIGVSLYVGLDSTTNQQDPITSYYSSILNRSEMWFNNTAQPAGYVFLNFQGKIDTTVNATVDVSQMQPFVYRVGTNAQYQHVVMYGDDFNIIKDEKEVIHVNINYFKLLTQIRLNVSSNLTVISTDDNKLSSANLIFNDMPNIFSYEK